MSKIKQILGSSLFLVGQIVTMIIFSLITATIGRLYPPVPRAHFIAYWAKFINWWLKVCCNIDYQVTGLENLPEEPSMILSNHQSAWETIVFQVIFPAQSHVLKRELMWIPFFGWGLAANFPLVINRAKKTEALKQLVRLGKERLEQGRWIVIFPEGTRQPVGHPGTYQAGGAYIAVQAGAKIVPVAHNAGKYWPKKGFLKKPGTIQVVVGKPIDTEGRKPREINQEVEHWINSELQQLV